VSALPLALLMVGVVVAVAFVGRPLIQAATPLLIRFPRVTVLSLGGSLLLWMASVIAAGLFLAWSLTGPSPLPAPMAEVCQRCLEASNPFASGVAVETSVPSVVFLLAPALALAVVAVLGLRSVSKRHAQLRTTCQTLLPVGRRENVAGYQVTVIADPQPAAFALGQHSCGIIVSTGLLEALNEQELRAVLEHEAAHLRERHHLILDFIGSITGPLKWVPFAVAIADAVPHYLEISADNAAQRRVGTRPLASALLIMGDASSAQRTATQQSGPQRMMLAAGPERVRQLISPADPRQGTLGAVAIFAIMTVLVVTSTAAHGAALAAVVTGCAI
jgi:Zn-dependent protease with chaperone function